MATSTIPILFDKTHLTSIGERLYTQSLDLVRELVANAYDADATRVNIVAETDRIVVEDNGTGMDRAGIEQYFTIGSRFKKSYPTSRTYHRTRIGEFGIGKFAVLSLCDRFELYTRTETYAATVIFDKEDFEKREKWEVPIIEHEIGGSSKETGTRVVLYDIKKRLEVYDMDRYLTSTFPLTEPDFSLFLNERKLEPKYIVGERVTINHSSTFGKMKGEIILASLTIPRELTGIGVRVKGILVQRSTFELDQKHELMMRKITGEIRADFLPITTDRGGFIKDSPEYQYFMSFMQKKLQQVIKKLEKRSLAYSDTKSEKLLSDVLSKLRNSLQRNNDIFGSADLPLFTKKNKKNIAEPEIAGGIIGKQLLKKSKKHSESSVFSPEEEMKKALKNAVDQLRPKMRKHVKTVLKDERRIVKKITIGGSELLVSFAHLGVEDRESFVDGGIIFINRDHSLYKKIEKKSELAAYHLMRLVSQELIKFAHPRNLDTAFDWQGKLLADAYKE
ncbi:hypothetical protein COY15_05430 [Candidatus Roizmanbacteria bacterium CG_4_10_14_0_2_um_filter_39_12]|nr:MAG: hypothetical protein COY15_05430 [Candidatus Roizmanbacteria bacterium CG_4_10_14_0_2_um_filter_39_12]